MGRTELAVGLDPSENILENGIVHTGQNCRGIIQENGNRIIQENGHTGEKSSENIHENGGEHNRENVRFGENGNGYIGENGSESIQENGHTGDNVDPRFPCGRPSCSILATKKCSKCRAVYYCSRQALQKRFFMTHQKSFVMREGDRKKYFEVSLIWVQTGLKGPYE